MESPTPLVAAASEEASAGGLGCASSLGRGLSTRGFGCRSGSRRGAALEAIDAGHNQEADREDDDPGDPEPGAIEVNVRVVRGSPSDHRECEDPAGSCDGEGLGPREQQAGDLRVSSRLAITAIASTTMSMCDLLEILVGGSPTGSPLLVQP